MANGETTYSEHIAGERGNYNWPVRFDMTDGFLGLTQGGDRILLSPRQVKKMLAFIAKNES